MLGGGCVREVSIDYARDPHAAIARSGGVRFDPGARLLPRDNPSHRCQEWPTPRRAALLPESAILIGCHRQGPLLHHFGLPCVGLVRRSIKPSGRAPPGRIKLAHTVRRLGGRLLCYAGRAFAVDGACRSELPSFREFERRRRMRRMAWGTFPEVGSDKIKWLRR